MGEIFFAETPERHIVGWFQALFVKICSRVFVWASPRKRTLQKVTERLFSSIGWMATFGGEFPTEPNLTKVVIWVGVTDVINLTKFGNDRFREYKVTKGRILPCCPGMACRITRFVIALSTCCVFDADECRDTLYWYAVWIRVVIALSTCCVWRRWMPRHALLVRRVNTCCHCVE